MAGQHFEEISVERLNIVDKEGKPRLVLAGPGVPPGTIDGRTLHSETRPPGILFFNDEGDECGGLIFSGQREPDGTVSSGASLTFDRWKQDQVVQLIYGQQGDSYFYGFIGVDRPEMKLPEMVDRFEKARAEEDDAALAELQALSPMRFFLGRERDGGVTLFMMDSKGRPRIRMRVDANDVPRLEFLDEEGKVSFSLPPE